jgi:hypothetical protein
MIPISIDDSFEAFHKANPHVYERLVHHARVALRAGRHRGGIGMLYELVRWERYIETTGDTWKLNNNFRSRYARLIMRQELDLVGFFDTRELTSLDRSEHAPGPRAPAEPAGRVCPCGSEWGVCPECGERYTMGTTAHCSKAPCAAVNAPIDCERCGRVVCDDLTGVITLEGALVPWRTT